MTDEVTMTHEERAHKIIRSMNEYGMMPDSRLRPALMDHFAAIEREAYERAAQECDAHVEPSPQRKYEDGWNESARRCAAAIRALKESGDDA